MARTGPVTKDTTTVALGLAQIRVGVASTHIASTVPRLEAADSLGALANTKFSGNVEYYRLESGFPLLEDAIYPLREAAALECAFKELTPKNVAIARGLYRPHDMIILDEPTAAIDPLEEDRVYRTFLDTARGKTAIIVTHRLGLARTADRILVMERGRIVQDGSHTELIATPGQYARMFQAQAAWYERSDC